MFPTLSAFPTRSTAKLTKVVTAWVWSAFFTGRSWGASSQTSETYTTIRATTTRPIKQSANNSTNSKGSGTRKAATSSCFESGALLATSGS
jgi:hypothetical protein